MQWLGEGHSAATIAARLDVSISTVHTHLKRAREKLRLPGVESLIGFAARYCVADRESAGAADGFLQVGGEDTRSKRRRA
jgi:hypothetical protein